MSRFRIRPRFEQEIHSNPEAVQDRISKFFASEFKTFEVKQFPGFTCLRIPEADRHFWSPRLNLSFDEAGDAKTLIHGVYGPNANVWSLLFYGYLILGFLGMVFVILSISQWAIGTRPWGFWGLGGTVLALAVLYFVAKAGRRIGTSQILRLHRAYQKAIGESIAIR